MLKLSVPLNPEQFTPHTAISVILQPKGSFIQAYQIFDPEGAAIHDPLNHESKLARAGDFILIHGNGQVEVLPARQVFERYSVIQAQKLPREVF